MLNFIGPKVIEILSNRPKNFTIYINFSNITLLHQKRNDFLKNTNRTILFTNNAMKQSKLMLQKFNSRKIGGYNFLRGNELGLISFSVGN